MLKTNIRNQISELIKTDKIERDFSIQLAYSGGLDSSCLLHILTKLRKNLNFRIFVTYVNYQTSPYSLKVFKELSKIPSDITISTIDAKIGINKNFESEARKIRYSFLNKISKKYNIDYTFTAHHYEDQIETLVMKFIDCNDAIGMQGIRKKTGSLFRPMLDISKTEIVNYVRKNKISYLEDPTNTDISFIRNKVRKIIIPSLMKNSFLVNKIKDINQKSILRFENTKKEINKKIEELNFQKFDSFKFISLSIYDIKNKDIVYIKLLFKSILKRFFNKIEYHKSRSFWLELFNFVMNSKTGSLFLFSHKISLLKDRKNIILFDKAMLMRKSINKLKIDRKIRISIGSIEVIKGRENKVLSKNEYILDKSDFKKGVFVRNWREGDKVWFDYGNKKVSDLFVDFKLPVIKKKIYPIVEDSQGKIIWIPEMYSKKTKLSENKILLKWNY